MELEEAIRLLQDTNLTNFDEKALHVFRFQQNNVPTYREYVRLVQGEKVVQHISEIPFLPVSLFKHHALIAQNKEAAITYLSSSTSGQGQSRHWVAYNELYHASFLSGFERFYGPIESFTILCLLPGYMERAGSSLIEMAHELVKRSEDPESGFFLHNHEKLYQSLLANLKENKKILLLGVSFALLDFAEKYQLPPSNNLIVMETGGMKGRRREPVREELHQFFQDRFGVAQIHSEYGMTELLSQAYSQGKGIFYGQPWMRVLVRDQNDPFAPFQTGVRGRICVIDLANVFSCSFIETEDLGIAYPDGSFEVLGRLDHSDVRGCNVMASK